MINQNRKIEFGNKRIYVGGAYIGVTKNGGTRITLNGAYLTVDDVEQIEGVFADIEKGIPVEFETELYEVSVANIKKLTGERLEGDSAGGKTNLYLGIKTNYLSDEDSKELFLHPVGLPFEDTRQDWKFWKCALIFDATALEANRDTAQSLAVKFRIYPDETKPAGREYGVWGSWEITTSSALFGFVQVGPNLFDQGRHVPAITIKKDQRIRLTHVYGFGAPAEDGACNPITFQLNGALAAGTYTGIPIDNLSLASYLREGQYFKNANGEWFALTAVNYITATSATIDVERALFDQPVEQVGADDSLNTVYDQIGLEDRTLSASHLSASPAVVSVGNTYPGAADTRKGLAAWAAAGSANLNSTFGGKTTPNVVFTASA